MKSIQEGFSIIEVVVAMVFLSVILTALGGVTMAAARQMVATTDASTLEAASLEVVNRLTTMPYASLPAAAGCDTVGSVNNRYERCVSVTTSSKSAQVQLVTRPLQRVQVPATTVAFTRAAPRGPNPLCIGC